MLARTQLLFEAKGMTREPQEIRGLESPIPIYSFRRLTPSARPQRSAAPPPSTVSNAGGILQCSRSTGKLPASETSVSMIRFSALLAPGVPL